MADFVHLHTHTEFSLLDGLSSVQALATYAAELGMSALAITDHGAMFGVVDFYKACKSAGIKPIIGVEAYIAQNSRYDRDHNEKPYHIVLLAQNQAGYQNLLKLASIAQLEGFYYKPRIDKDVLAQHSEGLIALTACAQGEIPQLLFQGQIDQARAAVRWYQTQFPDRFYFELQSHLIPEFDPVYRQMVELGREMGVPLVATNDIHYAKREQADAHDVLLCIGTGKTVNESNRMRMTDPSYYMRSPEEMARLYAHLPEALENTVKIAEQCNVEIKFAPPYHLPKFPVPEGRGDSETFLRDLCYKGLVRRYGEARAQEPEVIERLEYELGIIHTMGFDDYFLIVWDLCEAAKERDIWWNVRGSGAGSVVAYSLGITSVDPFKNRLLFERFLNPDRISMPDIDLDYPDDRREELITYTAERYGADRVAAIITFGTLGARAAIRDVGRALDIPLNEVDRAARLIPNVPGKPVSIAQALEEVSDLKEMYDTIPYVKKLLDTAREVEGVTRHASTHAAGILISDRPLVEYMPLHRPTKGEGEGPIGIVSQWPMEIVDMLGMLKVDFLGLRTLTHVRKTCEWIEREHGRVLTMNTIPYERVPDDPEQDADVMKLYELLTSGETTGIFQVEGAGMRRILRDMRPDQFQQIIAVLALYRPGPMENIPSYIRRMHGEEEIQFHHSILQNILDDTYGIIVYQEQIMQIAVAMAGYKPGEADGIRKAVAKKVRYLMDKHKQMFLEGALKKGIPEEVSEKVWADIEFFARYGFNRAHATDYAVITAQTAYLKAHYPLEFMTALMTTERHNTEKLGFLIAEARRSGLEVLRPCINRSEVEFTIEHTPEGRAIRIGLGAIKNVGDEMMRLVVDARRARGPFKTLDDFADRVDLRKLNRKALECLIQTGALDDFGARPALLTLIDALIGASGQVHSARDVGQFSLFDAMPGATQTIKPPSFVPAIPERRLLEWEKELLGTYLSRHPLAQQENELLRQDLVNTTVDRLATEALGQQLTLVGAIQRVRRIATKKGDTMAFVTLEGSGGAVDVTVFPRVYERFKDKLVVESVVVVSGKLDNRQDREEHSLLADWFKEPHELLRPVEDGGYAAIGYTAPPFIAEAAEFYGTEPDFPDDVPPVNAPNGFAPNGNGNGATTQTRVAAPVAPPTPPSPKPKPPTAPLSTGGNGERHVIPPPPEEPPAPPATVYVTLPRTGDPSRDFARLAQLHNLFKAESGQDNFVVYLENDRGKRVELSFPNERTRFTPHLKEQVAGLVGAENIRVMGSW
ncbi:MAG TPA: DNA polymerase III subunit alpha [Anaerolineae bacterium]|nr:DNA polymerase III subunit alpha [Anaerolineae bacterium]HQI85891.1 DNA polymerase III subunit alpha [Anaerolineae bacterium]